MPIDSDEWNKGRSISQMEKAVLKFLRANRKQGFSSAEVTRGLYRLSTANLGEFAKGMLTLWAVESTLNQLVKDGDAKVRELDGTFYYRAA